MATKVTFGPDNEAGRGEEQGDWLKGALEVARSTTGQGLRRSFAAQDLVNRMIDAAPHVMRIQVLAERSEVRRFASEDGTRLIYRGREIVPVRHRDPLRPWAGVVQL
jgi:hypothetical protein